MSLLGGFEKLLGIKGAQPAAKGKGLFSGAEDGAPVLAPGGIMPLSSVNPGTPWQNMPQATPRSPFPTINGQTGPWSPSYMRANSLQVGGPGGLRPGAQYAGLQPSTSFDGNLQGYTEDDMSNGLQGGMVNQGYIPFQGSQGSAAIPLQDNYSGSQVSRIPYWR